MGKVAITRRIVETKFTIPRNTLSTAPLSSAVALGRTQLVEIQVIIPNGHVGLTGMAVQVAGQRVLPWDDPLSWLRGNGEDRTFPLDVQTDARVVLLGYNTGVLEHSFYVRWTLDDAQYLRTDATRLIRPA